MKILILLLSVICTALLSWLAFLYGTGRTARPPEVAPPVELAPSERNGSMFPEQSRAVEELLKAIVARQESMERQEKLLNEREEQIGQETAVLTRMREELTTAKTEIDSYLKKMDELAVGWDADERKNTRKLAEFYAKMDPQNAAKLLAEIEPQRVALILANLSDRQAGAIMDAAVTLGPDGIKLAVKWTDIIRQMKEPKKPTPPSSP